MSYIIIYLIIVVVLTVWTAMHSPRKASIYFEPLNLLRLLLCLVFWAFSPLYLVICLLFGAITGLLLGIATMVEPWPMLFSPALALAEFLRRNEDLLEEWRRLRVYVI
jgi:hypothetical protein